MTSTDVMHMKAILYHKECEKHNSHSIYNEKKSKLNTSKVRDSIADTDILSGCTPFKSVYISRVTFLLSFHTCVRNHVTF